MTLESKFFYFELEYKTTIESKIKIFHNSFVAKNRDKCEIIYNGKEYELNEFFEYNDNNNHDISMKIQLRINNNISDLSVMFYKCKELLSIKDISNIDDSNNTNIPI